MAYINEFPKMFSKQVTEARWREIFGDKREKILDKKKKQRKVKSSRKNKK